MVEHIAELTSNIELLIEKIKTSCKEELNPLNDTNLKSLAIQEENFNYFEYYIELINNDISSLRTNLKKIELYKTFRNKRLKIEDINTIEYKKPINLLCCIDTNLRFTIFSAVTNAKTIINEIKEKSTENSEFSWVNSSNNFTTENEPVVKTNVLLKCNQKVRAVNFDQNLPHTNNKLVSFSKTISIENQNKNNNVKQEHKVVINDAKVNKDESINKIQVDENHCKNSNKKLSLEEKEKYTKIPINIKYIPKENKKISHFIYRKQDLSNFKLNVKF